MAKYQIKLVQTEYINRFRHALKVNFVLQDGKVIKLGNITDGINEDTLSKFLDKQYIK